MSTTLDDLSRRIMIHCCQDRTITFRDRKLKEPIFNGVALPVFSVDTKEEAEELQVLLCSRVPADHPLMPNKPWYKIDMGIGKHYLELDDLEVVSDKLRLGYQKIKDMNHGKE